MQYAPIVQASRSSYCQFAALAPKELPYNEQLVKVSRKEAQKARTDFKAQQRMLAQVLECQWDLSVEIDGFAACPPSRAACSFDGVPVCVHLRMLHHHSLEQAA